MLKDKIVVITGGAGLIGKEFVKSIIEEGGIAVIADIDKKRGIEATKAAEKYSKSKNVFFVNLDITSKNSIKECIALVHKKYGKIDGLVNNAARNPSISKDQKINFNRLESFDRKAWDLDLSVGVTGSFLCIKYYGYQISLNENGGSIVNISSDLGIIAPDQRIYEQEGLDKDKQPVKPISYSVVKSALLGLSRYVATYWASENVRSNCLLPGGVQTDQDDVFINKLTNLIPLKRMAKNNEYQAAIIFLLSDASSYMTGTNLIMDGGRSTW